MVSNRCLSSILFFLLIGLASSSFIPYDLVESHGSTGRALLQARAGCPIAFETLNYTIITSQCKGPQYSPTRCCESFKQLACPYANEISDRKTDCAETVFSYINLYGKYPPGLFSSLCKEGKKGLECDQDATESVKTSESNKKSGALVGCTYSPMLALTAGFLMLLLNWF